MLQRPRRNRKSAVIRDMIQETRLDASNLIFPLFIIDGNQQKLKFLLCLVFIAIP